MQVQKVKVQKVTTTVEEATFTIEANLKGLGGVIQNCGAAGTIDAIADWQPADGNQVVFNLVTVETAVTDDPPDIFNVLQARKREEEQVPAE